MKCLELPGPDFERIVSDSFNEDYNPDIWKGKTDEIEKFLNQPEFNWFISTEPKHTQKKKRIGKQYKTVFFDFLNRIPPEIWTKFIMNHPMFTDGAFMIYLNQAINKYLINHYIPGLTLGSTGTNNYKKCDRFADKWITPLQYLIVYDQK